MFEVKYQLNFNDYQCFLKALRRRRRTKKLSKRNIYLGIVLVLILGLLAMTMSSPSELLTFDTLFPFALIGVAYLLLMRFAVPKLWRARFDAEKIGASPVVLRVDEHELCALQNDVETHMAWRRLEDVTHSDEQILLWLGPVQSMIVPKRAFVDADQARDFIAFVSARIKTAS